MSMTPEAKRQLCESRYFADITLIGIQFSVER
jgi:hypothetical protein